MRSELSLLLLLGGFASGFGATHHVAKTGLNSADGSAEHPWKTIQYAIDHSTAGDTILVHAGKYVEQVTLKSGIDLEAFSDGRPIIDGTGLAIADDGLVAIKNAAHVVVSGFLIQNYKTALSAKVPVGIFVQGTGNDIRIANNVITKIQNTGTNAGAINALGIAVYGSSSVAPVTNLVIDGNEIFATKTGNSETLTVNGNVDGFTISHNYIHDVNNIGIDCIGFEKTCKDPAQDFARNGVVSDNRVENVTSYANPAYHHDRSADGIYVDGGGRITIERNVVRAADIGIEVTSEHGGQNADEVIVRSNLVTASNVVGLSIGGYARAKGGTTHCTFVNNTFFQNDTKKTGSGEFQIQYNTSDNVFKNNIVVASSQGVLISSLTGANSTVGVVADYNLYKAPGAGSWKWNGHTYNSFAAFQSGTGSDAHGLNVDPAFADSTGGDFHLSPGSPARNAGIDLGAAVLGLLDLGGEVRVQGSAPDLGAYEFGGAKP